MSMKIEKIEIRLPGELKNRLDNHCKPRFINRSELIRGLIEKYLDENETEQEKINKEGH